MKIITFLNDGFYMAQSKYKQVFQTSVSPAVLSFALDSTPAPSQNRPSQDRPPQDRPPQDRPMQAAEIAGPYLPIDDIQDQDLAPIVIHSFKDLPDGLYERFKEEVDFVLEKQLRFDEDYITITRSQIDQDQISAIRDYVAGLIYCGLNPVNPLRVLYNRYIITGQASYEAIEKHFFPLTKIPEDYREDFAKAHSDRSEQVKQIHDSIFGKDNDYLIFPLEDQSLGKNQSYSLAEEIKDFLSWYNQIMRMNDQPPLEWDPENPNKTYSLNNKGERQNGPKLMKLLRLHDWYLYELIEILGGIGTKDLFKKELQKELKEKQSASNKTADFIRKMKYRQSLYALFDGRQSEDYDVIDHNNLDQYRIILSRHPNHIGAWSTNQIWRSCMQLDGRHNQKNMLHEDIRHGSLVAYLVHKDDLACRYPLMRRSLKPGLNSGGNYAFKIEHHYGIANASELALNFLKTLTRFVSETLNHRKRGSYKIDTKLYCDDGRSFTSGAHFNQCDHTLRSNENDDQNLSFREVSDTIWSNFYQKHFLAFLKKQNILEPDINELPHAFDPFNIQGPITFYTHWSHFSKAMAQIDKNETYKRKQKAFDDINTYLKDNEGAGIGAFTYDYITQIAQEERETLKEFEEIILFLKENSVDHELDDWDLKLTEILDGYFASPDTVLDNLGDVCHVLAYHEEYYDNPNDEHGRYDHGELGERLKKISNRLEFINGENASIENFNALLHGPDFLKKIGYSQLPKGYLIAPYEGDEDALTRADVRQEWIKEIDKAYAYYEPVNDCEEIFLSHMDEEKKERYKQAIFISGAHLSEVVLKDFIDHTNMARSYDDFYKILSDNLTNYRLFRDSVRYIGARDAIGDSLLETLPRPEYLDEILVSPEKMRTAMETRLLEKDFITALAAKPNEREAWAQKLYRELITSGQQVTIDTVVDVTHTQIDIKASDLRISFKKQDNIIRRNHRHHIPFNIR